MELTARQRRRIAAAGIITVGLIRAIWHMRVHLLFNESHAIEQALVVIVCFKRCEHLAR